MGPRKGKGFTFNENAPLNLSIVQCHGYVTAAFTFVAIWRSKSTIFLFLTIERFTGLFSLNVNPYPFLGPIHYKEKLFDQFNKKADCSFSPLIFCRGSRNQIIFHYPTLGNHQVLGPFQFLQQKNRWFASPNCNKSQSCRHLSMRVSYQFVSKEIPIFCLPRFIQFQSSWTTYVDYEYFFDFEEHC